MRYVSDMHIPRAVKIWLVVGLVMVLMQIVIGGVTRLTGSGLSITKWEIVTGTIPPLSEAAWQAEFELYKATPQYAKINQGMELSAFKFIYFWEYFHRLWARLMFFVFVFPFAYFLWRGWLSRRLVPRLWWVVGLAGLEGFFGWIMVASGLRSRPWVNAYNLTLHLTMGILIFSYLLWTAFVAFQSHADTRTDARQRRLGWILVGVSFVQIALGAMMSGTKAGLSYPTWPDMNGVWVPAVILDGSQWQAHHFVEYDQGAFMVSLIQFFHRNVAYLLTALIVFFWWKTRSETAPRFRYGMHAVGAALGVQITLGILTLLNCRGSIPVALGVYHQSGAVLLLACILYVVYQMEAAKRSPAT
jgi:heme a synthase